MFVFYAIFILFIRMDGLFKVQITAGISNIPVKWNTKSKCEASRHGLDLDDWHLEAKLENAIGGFTIVAMTVWPNVSMDK